MVNVVNIFFVLSKFDQKAKNENVRKYMTFRLVPVGIYFRSSV